MIVCTVAGRALAAEAIVLARSVKKYNPESRMVLCLVEHHLPAVVSDCFDEVVVVTNNGRHFTLTDNLGIAKAYILRHLLNGYEPDAIAEGELIVYLDPETKLFAPLSELTAWAEHDPILAAPYRLEPVPMELDVREIERLHNGYLHDGFVVLRKSEAARKFVDWWSKRVERSNHGEDSDQHAGDKWLSVAMVPFRIGLIRHPSYHAAVWNADESRRRLFKTAEGGFVTKGGGPLRTFCFAFYDNLPDAGRIDPVLKALLKGYKNEVEEVRRQIT